MNWTAVDYYVWTILNSLILLLVTTIVAAATIAFAGYVARPRAAAIPTHAGGVFGAFALLGTVSGVIAGASQEGLVSAFLTGMLGIVSSLLAFAFGKDAFADFRPLLPRALSVLLLGALTGLVIGSAFRAFGDQAKRAETDYRTLYDQVYAPVERERRLELLKACIAAQPTYQAKLLCH